LCKGAIKWVVYFGLSMAKSRENREEDIDWIAKFANSELICASDLSRLYRAMLLQTIKDAHAYSRRAQNINKPKSEIRDSVYWLRCGSTRAECLEFAELAPDFIYKLIEIGNAAEERNTAYFDNIISRMNILDGTPNKKQTRFNIPKR